MAHGLRGHRALWAVGAEIDWREELPAPGTRDSGWQRRAQAASVSLSPALQGSSWLHVGTDQPFASVSIGGCYQVWAVARDGSAFYRGSVSPSQPAGECCHLSGGPHRCNQAVMGSGLVRGRLLVLPLPGEAGWLVS